MRILVWSPIPVWPALTGSQARIGAITDMLVSLGHEVHLFAPLQIKGLASVEEFQIESRRHGLAGLDTWKPNWVDRLRMHGLHPLVRQFLPALEPLTNLLGRGRQKRLFRERVRQLRPDLLFCNYAFSAMLLERDQDVPAVCDMLDLLTLNYRMQASVRKRSLDLAAPGRWKEPTDGYRDLSSGGGGRELALLGRFDGVVAIVSREQSLLEAAMGERRVLHLPMLFPSIHGEQASEGGGGIFLGDNPLNLEGLAWFVGNCLPRVRASSPDFEILVAGTVCDRLRGKIDGLRILGRVQDPAEFYRQVSWVACPTFLGTGEQFKIGEAMCHGKATISFDWMSSPVRDGIDGFRVGSTAGFCEAVQALDGDREMARAMGAQSRERVLESRSPEHHLRRLGGWIESIVDRRSENRFKHV